MEKELTQAELDDAAPIGRFTIVFAQAPPHINHILLAFVWNTDPAGHPHALTKRTICGIWLFDDRKEDWSDPTKNRTCLECRAALEKASGRDGWRRF